jgi:hypothetical protein
VTLEGVDPEERRGTRHGTRAVDSQRGSSGSSQGRITSPARGDSDENPRVVAPCDSSDPLCGVDFGGPLDA